MGLSISLSMDKLSSLIIFTHHHKQSEGPYAMGLCKRFFGCRLRM